MKRYTKKTAGLVFLLLVTSVAFGLLVAYGFRISAAVTFGLLLIEVYSLFRLMERSDRLFKQFIWSMRYSDFLSSGTPLQEQGDKIPQDLVNAMEEALQHYKKHLQEKESQLQYFQALANHIDLSVFVYSESGQVEWMNQAFKIQTGLNFAETIDDLAAYHPELPARLRTLHPGELSILQVRRKEDYSQLILSSISFVVLGKPLKVVSMKNIRSVLENKETEAWQKLIRVLTHEIMNSMTPIVSLSELLRNKCMDEATSDAEEREETGQAIETIYRRSSGLVRFVESYRKVAGIPTPIPEIIPVNSLLNDACLLFKEQENILKVLPSTAHLQVIADKGLIEQVLINLIKNALDATRHRPDPQIELSAGINEEGKTFIRVSDNGTGIPADVQERIFIPFFTTKPSGSGIGLSISRQIMHMHKGDLTVTSEDGTGSRFLLLFS
ncbi:GHKL domain-containing protein [Parabacteroides sp. AF48-14]|uniref:sensor histidine kinase n=1 Tax=Parabacteroides sp. AF48-14 TaxID=2292052 RepID=UPI000EFE50CF|nr:HAMP domain-containing sensor histidine kinase [Parabacteroides sp. AF48-14]RHO68224.1 GHKL domain-containing protein [Parabacteroides sp. AF48-14]